MEILQQINDNLQRGKAKLVAENVEQALGDGCSASEILNGGLLPGMEVVGQKFKNNEIFIPEVMASARAMKKGLELIRPLLVAEQQSFIGKAVIGTVKGDQHDIGKNLVAMMLEGAGLLVIDLGVDVSAEKFVQAVQEHSPDLVVMSALLTTTMKEQGTVIEALKAAGLREQVKVMVGGAPVTQAFADRIGADAYTPDAATAAEVAKNYVLNK